MWIEHFSGIKGKDFSNDPGNATMSRTNADMQLEATFAGWDFSNYGTWRMGQGPDQPVYAFPTLRSPSIYRISYDSNGATGGSMGDDFVEFTTTRGTYPALANPFTLAGRTFLGWSTNGSTVTHAPGDPITVTNNHIVISAIWSEPTAGAPSITAQPQSRVAAPGDNVTFTVSASGNPAPTYQWEVSTNNGGSWSNVSGGTNASLTLTGVALSDNGNRYRCVITNSAGDVTSTVATLTVAEEGFGPNPGTGIANMTGTAAAMIVFIVLSAALWGYIIIRKRKTNG